MPLHSHEPSMRLIARSVDEQVSSARSTRIDGRVQLRAEATPDTVAVRCGSRSCSYLELENAARRVASGLARRGVGRGSFVGVRVRRNELLPSILLGIIRAGAAYVPLDHGLPHARARAMATAAGASAIVTDDAEVEAWSHGLCVVSVDELSQSASPSSAIVSAHENDPAYVLFTSGSSGMPKGVVVSHRNVLGTFDSLAQRIAVSDADVWLAGTSLGFDISVVELFWPLTIGASTVVADVAPLALARAMEAQHATHFQCTPSLASLLLRLDPFAKFASTLQVLLVAGEVLTSDLASRLQRLVARGRVANLYGPTEATIYTTMAWVESTEVDPPIGHGLSNASLYVLDEAGKPSDTGELYIGGNGVALGYVGRSDLTHERFRRDPFRAEPGAMMYRTGDQVRMGEDGQLHFLGRIDSQIKIGGQRVELGEVEAQLRQQNGIVEATVVPAGTGPTTRLAAFVVLAPGACWQPDEWRREAAKSLPAHMLPSSFTRLDRMPLSDNGKLDRSALQALSTGGAIGVDACRTDPTSAAIAAIWRCLLGQDDVTSDRSFRELGGHSLLVHQMIGRLEEHFKVTLNPSTVFAASDLAGLAEIIRSERERAGGGVERNPQRTGYAVDLSYLNEGF
jgi:amino acid adenylation domain-containing protein